MSKYKIQYEPFPTTDKYFKVFKKLWYSNIGEYMGGFKTIDEAISHVETLNRMDLYNKKGKKGFPSLA